MHVIHLQSKLPLLVYDLREPVLNQSIATQTNKQTKTYLEMQRQTNMLNLFVEFRFQLFNMKALLNRLKRFTVN